MHQLRRIALAVAVAVVAVGAIALGAGAATSSPSTVAPRAVATDGNPGQQPSQPNNPNIAPSNLTGIPKTSNLPPLTSRATTQSPPKTTTSPPKTSASTSSVSPSTSGSRSAPGSPSGSASAGAGPGIVGGVLMNCAGRAVTTPTVMVGSVGGRQALVDSDGCALYLNTQDTPQQSVCTGGCLTTWPPLLGPAQGGAGVQQQSLATFTRPDNNARQVTYFGHQLYYFHGDTAPGQANGQGLQQVWFLVDPSGNAITQ